MSLKPKYKFKDLSLIRWVNDLSHFKDRFNPQNNQYFGHPENPYKLQIKNDDEDCFYDGIHRLVITNYDIDLEQEFEGEFKVWFVSDKQEFTIPSIVKNDNENIYYATFFLDENSETETGRLELRKSYKAISEEILINNSFDDGITSWDLETGTINIGVSYIDTLTFTLISQNVNINLGDELVIGYDFESINNTSQLIISLEDTDTSTVDNIYFSGNVGQGTRLQGSFTYITTKKYNKFRVNTLNNFASNTRLYEFSFKKNELIHETCKYSDCIKFVDEPLTVLHTRNYFDRKGIKWSYEPIYNWIRTTVPTKDLGLTDINSERTIEYIGNRNTPIAIESRDDESIKYEFLVDGHANVLDSIKSLSGNVQGSDVQGGFYLDLKKLTPEGDMDRADDSINGTMTYLLHKNDDGSDVFIDDDLIFNDLRPFITDLSPLDESIFTENIDNEFTINVFYNIPIELNNDPSLEIRIFKDNILIETLTYLDVIGVSDNILYVKASEVYPLGEYKIEIDDNFVYENTFGLYGANGLNDWNFKVNQPRIYNNNYSDVYS